VRLFVAVDLDERVRASVGHLLDRLRSAMSVGTARNIGWVPSERLHLTLHFIGNVDDALADRIATAIRLPVHLAPFDLALGGVGTFPPHGRPRVIWLGVREGADPLAELHAEIGRRLTELDVEIESRAFAPHLTIGRLRAPVPPRALAPLLRVDASNLGRCRIDRVRLYESKLGSGGPTYLPLENGVLAGSSAGRRRV
jgi:2'-5' RNA ligase